MAAGVGRGKGKAGWGVAMCELLLGATNLHVLRWLVLTPTCPPHSPNLFAMAPGRDNFLASEADRAIAALCSTVSEQRALSALLAGVGHRSPHVRCRAAAHLDAVAAEGAGLEGLQRSSWALLERLFRCARGV